MHGPVLIGDLGGTNLRLAIARGGVAGPPGALRTADFPSLEAAVAAWLEQEGERPVAAALAVAGPVSGDEIAPTNLPWRFSREGLERRFGWDRVEIMNDFAAQALSVPLLGGEDLVALGGGAPAGDWPKVVLGPGTGLGVCALVRTPDGRRWMPVPGEGGHVTLAAMDDEEAEILRLIRREHSHVSAERVCSGIGLPGLFAALRTRDGGPVEHPSPAEIGARARAGDTTARETIERFSRFLGTIAADMALVYWAAGGVYLAGGILPRLGPLFLESGFRRRFETKGRFSAAMRQVPTYLVTAADPAMRGLASHVAAWQDDPP